MDICILIIIIDISFFFLLEAFLFCITLDETNEPYINYGKALGGIPIVKFYMLSQCLSLKKETVWLHIIHDNISNVVMQQK